MENTIISTTYLSEAIEMAKEIVIRNNIDVPFDKISNIKISGRTKRASGKCFYKPTKDKCFEIHIAKYLFNMNKKIILEVLLHELIHTVVDCFNHGNKFTSIMNKINKAENLNISVVLDSDEMAQTLVANNAINSFHKYEIICANCGKHLAYVDRKSHNIIKYPFLYSCKACGGKIGIIEL